MDQHNVVCFGEVLWDILPAGAKPGGAPMNVAYHLHKSGMNPAMITRIGEDEWGWKLKTLLHQQGVSTKYIQIDEGHTTGLVKATPKENNEVEYDIVYPVAWDFIEWWDEFSSLVRQAEYFVFGSLAARHEVSRKTLFRLLEEANTKVFDINLRPPHYERASLIELLNKADILKLNEHEVRLISGWFHNYSDIEDQVKRVQQEFSINTILVTRGNQGALLLQDGKFYHHPGFKVMVADTVGSGDAFLAGYLCRISNGSQPKEALTFANALGAFMATQTGACPEYDIVKVEEMAVS